MNYRTGEYLVQHNIFDSKRVFHILTGSETIPHFDYYYMNFKLVYVVVNCSKDQPHLEDGGCVF